MGRYADSCFSSERPEQIVHIRIVHRLPGVAAPQLKEYVVGVYVAGMNFTYVACKKISEILSAVQLSRTMYCLDLCQVFKFPTVSDRNLESIKVEVFQPQGKCFTNPHTRFKKQIQQKIIPEICALSKKRNCLLLTDTPYLLLGNRHLQDAAS